MSVTLHESAENYLENILILKQKLGRVRSVDLATDMNFSKPSISRAVHLLESKGFLTIMNDGSLELTDKGQEVAESIYERHVFLSRMLMSFGVDEQTAAEDACRMEHTLSDQSFTKMKEHLNALVDSKCTTSDDDIIKYNSKQLSKRRK